MNTQETQQDSAVRSQEQPARYFWRRPNNHPERVELCDRASNRVVAEIVHVGRRLHWRRNTCVLFHGAPAAEGTSALLSEAKLAILSGLPDAPEC